MASSASLAERYAQDGYLVLDKVVVPPELLARAVDGMEAVRRGDSDTGRGCAGGNGGIDESGVLCKMELPQLASHAIREVVSLGAVGDWAARATGASWVQVWWTQLLGKPTGNGGENFNIGFHQDRNYWQSSWEEGSELLTAWVALSDVGEDAGPMKFIRSSNAWGLLDGANFFHEGDLAAHKAHCLSRAPAGAAWDEVAAVLPAGGISLHDNYTLHGSGPNTSGIYRRSLAVHMRTNRSQPKLQDGGTDRAGLTAYLDELDVNPVIYGREAFEADRAAAARPQLLPSRSSSQAKL